MGNTRLTVEQLDSSGARVTVESLPQTTASRRFQRWLVIPCRHAESTYNFDLSKVRETVTAVEDYWNDMAESAFSFGGGYVLALGADYVGNDPTPLPWNLASDASRPAYERVHTAAYATLNRPYPVKPQPDQLLWMDWRWFTGIVILRAEGGGAGALDAPMLLDAGSLSHALPPLSYDMIEMSMDDFSHATLARNIGRTLGLRDRPADRFDLMGPIPGALQYTAPQAASFGDARWGAMGPGLGTAQLRQRGWLEPSQVKSVAHGRGAIELQPVTRAGVKRAGTVRAEIGDHSFELRVPSGWDTGIATPVVLRVDDDQPPVEMQLGARFNWGAEGVIAYFIGGGYVDVKAISSTQATLEYNVQEGHIPRIGGGGSSRLGGTILIDANGVVHRLPIGDPSPFARRLRDIIGRGRQTTQLLVDRLRNLERR
jgi:hypothetical protein